LPVRRRPDDLAASETALVRSALAKRAMPSAEAIESIVNFFTFARILGHVEPDGHGPCPEPF
jgi:hypothetical protein